MPFGFFADAALTTPLTNAHTQTRTDGSSIRNNIAIWFGSTDEAKKVVAASNPGVDPVTVTPVSLLTTRANSTAYTVGKLLIPATPNNRVYEVTASSGAGLSGASPPTYPTTVGDTVADGDLTLTCIAYQDEVGEYKLAGTLAGLDSATPGAGISLGAEVLGGVSNAVVFYVRCTDADLVTQDQTLQLALDTNDLNEDAA